MAKQLRMTLFMSVAMAGLLLTFLAASPRSALGQEPCVTPHNCGPLYYTEFEWEQAGGNDRYKPPGWEGCEQCYVPGNPYPLPYFFCAPPCIEDQQQDSEQVATLVKAVSQGDLKVVLALAPYFPNSVAFHTERQSIQIRSCGGSIVANMPVAQNPSLAIMARQLVNSGSLSVAVADR